MVSARKREEKENHETPPKSQETKRIKREIKKARLVQGDLLTCLVFSSHNQGKSMKLECFSMRFNVSIACYNKLGQGL